jgi:hypothetical protein
MLIPVGRSTALLSRSAYQERVLTPAECDWGASRHKLEAPRSHCTCAVLQSVNGKGEIVLRLIKHALDKRIEKWMYRSTVSLPQY